MNLPLCLSLLSFAFALLKLNFDIENIPVPTYIANITIGYLKEPVSVTPELGMGVYLITPETQCFKEKCLNYGTYSPQYSRSFHNSSKVVKNPPWQGISGSDNLYIEKQEIKQAELVVVSEASAALGQLGLEEISQQLGYNSYSIYTTSPRKGVVLFGAIDNAKYYGLLKKIPMANNSLSLTSVTMTRANHTTASLKNKRAVLSTNSISSFDSGFINNVTKLVNGRYLEDRIIIDSCDVLNDVTIELNFQYKLIQVPANTLVHVDMGKWCEVRISKGDNVLGIDLLSNIYINVDYTQQQYGIAQAKYTNESAIDTSLTSKSIGSKPDVSWVTYICLIFSFMISPGS